MEERDAPTTPAPEKPPELRPHDPTLPFRPGTYIVQVPKDLVHRIPPPENALIVERHRKNTANKTLSRNPCGCCSCLLCCFVSVVVVVLGVGLLVGISLFLIQSKDPEFHVNQIVSTVNREKSSDTASTYVTKLKVENPNANAGILYGEGGVGWLSFREENIASGTFPSFFQGKGHSTEVEMIFDAVKSKKMERSKTSSKAVHVALSLEMEVPATVKKGVFSTGKLKFGVTCDVVVDKLGKGNRILSEECQTKRHV